MRKYFAALENEELPVEEFPIDEEAASISLEEEQLMLDEAAQDQQDVAQDLAEAERIIEVSDALEDLAVVADQITEATPAETALIEVAGNMAVAGTDVAPEEIVPAMEGYIGKRIATEGLREVADQIWRSIQRFLAQVWEKIASFFARIFGTVPAMRKRVKALKERAQKAQADKLVSETKSIAIRAGLSNLSVDGKPFVNVHIMNDGLKSLETAVDYVYGTYMKAAVKRADIIAKAIDGFDPKEAPAAAEGLRSALAGTDFGKIPGAKGGPANMFPGFDTELGEPLMGGVQLAAKSFKDTKEGGDLGALDRLRRSGVEVVKSPNAAKLPADMQMNTLTPEQVVGVCDHLDKLLVKLEEFQKGAQRKEVDKAKSEVEAASKKATAKFKGAEKSEDQTEKAAVPYYKAMVNFNAAYAGWIQSPGMPMLSLVLSCSRSVMNVAEKSLATYGAAKEEKKEEGKKD